MRTLVAALLLAAPLAASPLPQATLNEMRIAIDDLKYGLQSTQLDLNLLEERIKKKPNTSLEKKLAHTEELLEKVTADLRTLSARLQTLEQESAAHTAQLTEVAKLKGTLTSISEAIATRPSSPSTYRVQSGDTLGKIARNHHTTVDALKKLNKLTKDTIATGQELKIPDEKTAAR
ncbi:MAG: LysM peptidoglycan-binding domain-containing protein [Verrucomicrobia bacterium]|nr:LysM peptidoglycan-binding domain-containing protein [Verrucomicrobiota bacterium]